MKKFLSIFLCLLLVSANVLFVSAQTQTGTDNSKVAKIKTKINKREDENKRVQIKLTNGTKLKGYISQTREDSFDLKDGKTKQITSILYADVEQVSSGLSNGAKIGIIAGVAAGGAILLGILLRRVCNERAC